MMNYAVARQNMIEGQIRPNRVIDERLLAALAAVPREQFVPDSAKATAYVDEGIPLPGGRALMEPMVLARLLQEAVLTPSDRVLDIAGATGYGAALLAQLVDRVVLLESDAALAGQAEGQLRALDARNAKVVTGPLTAGWAAEAPYSLILIEGGVETMPEALLQQLADGGRLLAVQMGKAPIGQVVLWQKVGETVTARPLFDAGVTRLEAFQAPSTFTF